MPDFILYAYIAGILVALMAGPLGAFVAWQRLSFFGHSLAHSALIGVALSLFFQIEAIFGIILISILLSIALSSLYSRQLNSRDTSMAIIAHGSLALSLVLIAIFPEAQRYVFIYLFGDILALSVDDLLFLGIALVLSFIGLIFLWNPLLRLTIHEGIAEVEGTRVYLVRTLFMILVALVVSVSLKVLGGLLMTAMLILPAATARRLARSPEQMALIATLLGIVSVIMGIEGAQYFDMPPAASIVAANLILFLTVRLLIWRSNP